MEVDIGLLYEKLTDVNHGMICRDVVAKGGNRLCRKIFKGKQKNRSHNPNYNQSYSITLQTVFKGKDFVEWCKIHINENITQSEVEEIGEKMLKAGFMTREDTNEENSLIFAIEGSIYRLKKDNERFTINTRRPTKQFQYSALELVKLMCDYMTQIEQTILKSESKLDYKSDVNYTSYIRIVKYLQNVKSSLRIYFDNKKFNLQIFFARKINW